jgi:GR25 family glycosyltransferase involved in LPS biosynthesis
MFPEPGTVGCSLSHKIAWELFLESADEFAVIFEDDIKFDPQELSETIAAVMEKKHLWDIVGFELNHRGFPLTTAVLSNNKKLVVHLTNVKHAGAYIINRRAARLLLQKFYPIKMPVDHYYTRAWEFGIRFCGVEPRPVMQEFGDSQIKIKQTRERVETLQVMFANFFYNIHTSLMFFWYNFYCFKFRAGVTK